MVDDPGQLRVFSKRSAMIEAELAALGAAGVEAGPGRRRCLAGHPAERRTVSCHRRRWSAGWETEAEGTGLAVGKALDRADCYRSPELNAPSFEALASLLVDRDVGLCARSARFTEADVVEHLCAHAAGRLSLEEIQAQAARFLESDLVVRLVPDGEGRRAAEWSTATHRALEDRVIGLVDARRSAPAGHRRHRRHRRCRRGGGVGGGSAGGGGRAVRAGRWRAVGAGAGRVRQDGHGCCCRPRWQQRLAVRWWGWRRRPRRWPSSTAPAWPR